MSDPTKPPDPSPTPAAPEPAPAPVPVPEPAPPPPAPPAPAPAPEGGTVVTLTSRALKERLDRSTESGRKAHEMEMLSRATALGYSSVDEMIADLAKLKAAPPALPVAAPPAPAAEPVNPGSKAEDDKVANQVKKLTRENARLARRVQAAEANAILVGLASRVGIKDADYAVTLMTRHLEGKPEAEVAGFDQRKFFENLRTSHPYLFGDATLVPLTTGTGAGSPPAPAPGPVVKKTGEDGQVDVKKMSSAEFQAHVAKMGINVNGLQQ